MNCLSSLRESRQAGKPSVSIIILNTNKNDYRVKNLIFINILSKREMLITILLGISN